MTMFEDSVMKERTPESNPGFSIISLQFLCPITFKGEKICPRKER